MASFLGGLFSGIGGLAGGIASGVGKAASSFLKSPARKPMASAALSGPLGLFSSLGSSALKTGSKAGTSPLFSATPTLSAFKPSAFGGSFNFGGQPLSTAGSIFRSAMPAMKSAATQIGQGVLGSQLLTTGRGGVLSPFVTGTRTKFTPKFEAGGGTGFGNMVGSKLKEGLQKLFSDPEKLKALYEKVKGLFGGGGGDGGGGGGGEVPGLPASAEDLRAQLMAAGLGGPLGPTMLAKIKELLDQSQQGMTGEEEAAILRDLEQSEQDELDYVIDQYKNLRPGADIESDSAFRKDVGRVREKWGRVKQDSVAKARRQIREDYTRNLLNAVQVGQRSGEFTTGMLSDLSSMDLNRLMTQFGLNLEQAQQFRSLFGATNPLQGFNLGIPM